MKIWCLSAYPKGIQDVGDFVSSVEHKWRFLTQTVAVCQSYNVSQWYPRLWERKKTYTDKTKPNSIYIIFYLWSAANCPELVHTTVGAWHVFFFFLLYSGSQTYKYITTTYLSNGPLTLYLQSQLGVSMNAPAVVWTSSGQLDRAADQR